MWCNHGGAHVRPCFFHSRTQNRHLKDNDSGLDKSNYDLRPIPSETEEIGVKLGKNKNTTKNIFWTKQRPNLLGKQCWENVVSNLLGVKTEYRNYDTSDEAWSLFFDDDIIKYIITCTNQCILEKVAIMNENAKESNKATHLYNTSEREMKVFIGLWYVGKALNWIFHQVRTAIHDVYKMFNHKCAKVLVTDEFLSLDENLYTAMVGVAFRQYNKSKPAK